jgi:hypothetical protein
MIALSLRDLARALGGEVCSGQVLAPGPGHSPRDRSLSVRLSATAPEGFIAYSHAGDDFATCRDYVRERLGLDRWKAPRRVTEDRRRPPAFHPDEGSREQKIGGALSLWGEGVDPRGTLVEIYLRSRRLDLDADVAGRVLRWHARTGALIALFRNIETDEPQAVSRTFLDREGRKLGRKFLGPVGGAAIKLDADENVLGGLNIGEGAETCQAARQLGLRPAWALGSVGAVAAFPALSGVECLTLLAENDEASRHAVEACARRWHDAGREVLIDRALLGKDLNDALALRGAS